MSNPTRTLVMNGGSSSIKWALHEAGRPNEPSLAGALDRIGSGHATLTWHDATGQAGERRVGGASPESAAGQLVEWLETRPEWASVGAVGHRVVHGMSRTEPERVTTELLDELQRLTPYAPNHLPLELALIEALRARHPHLPQVACFDTAFHSAMPPVATLLPIPRRYRAHGLKRFGFHGISFSYLVEELARLAGAAAASDRVILAHLGHGASLAAVRGGTSIDTSMGFTPAAGLVMGTRSGDLDPGVVSFLSQHDQMTIRQFDEMVNHESGLLGVSGRSGDMRDLLAREADDEGAAEAVALFCYQAKKWVGAYAAALGGLDTLVFSAGIGERSAPIRSRICEGLGFLGIELDETRNDRHAPVISTDASRVTVRVIPTNEELMMARAVSRLLHQDTGTTET